MKIPKKINVKTALIFVAIGILLTSGLFYVLAATPSSTFYISSGVYPGAPSYTVWREGSNYFAKDANGQLKYTGTTIEVIQNAINELYDLGGGTIFLQAGTYVGNVWLKYNVNLIGEGERASVIEGMLTINYSSHLNPITIRDITANGKANGEDYGLDLEGTSAGIHVYNCRFSGDRAAIYCNGIVMECSFTDVEASWDGYEEEVGISILVEGYLYLTTFKDCYFGYNDYGLVQNSTDYAMTFVHFDTCVFEHFEVRAMDINRMQMCHFTNTYFAGGYDVAEESYILLQNRVDDTICYGNTFEGGIIIGRLDKFALMVGDYYESTKISHVDFSKIGTYKLGINESASNTLIDSPVNLPMTHISDNSTSTHYRGIGWDRGTSFPPDPKTGHQFYRTDLYALYIWNSTHWVTTGQGATGSTGPSGPSGTLEGQQPYDYLVFINGTSTYMINGETGDIDFNGSPSATINNALGNATGTVLLCSGTYTLTGDTGLTMDTNDVVLQGMGYSTSLECDAGFDDQIIHVTADYVTICEIQIDGTNQASSYHGILQDGNGNGGLFVHHVRIRDCGGDGIRLGDTDASWEANWAKIHHVVIKDNGEYGIHFTYDATDSELVDFLISGHDGVGDAGINVGCDNIRITTGHLWGNQYEMKIAEDDYSGKGSVNGLIVSNVGFMDGGEQGEHRIYHASSKNFINSVFSGCEIWVAKLSGTDTYDGFHLSGDTWCVSITACVFRGDTEADTKQGRYGIYMDASVHNCTIVSNTFEGFVQADPIQTTGATNLQEGYNVVYNCG